MSDQGFHEVQLSGKQLVFLFMSAIVLLVVTFLLGVDVGRGARTAMGETDLATQAEANRIAVVPIVPNRGLIVDRNGVVLATNYSAYTLEISTRWSRSCPRWWRSARATAAASSGCRKR